MTLPKKNFTIKVGPFTYQVKYSLEIAEEGQAFGSTHNNEQMIFLDPNKPIQKIEQTFLHEVLHACSFMNGLAYRFEDKEGRKPTEEDVVREMSMSLYQVMKDNPSIFNGGKKKKV